MKTFDPETFAKLLLNKLIFDGTVNRQEADQILYASLIEPDSAPKMYDESDSHIC